MVYKGCKNYYEILDVDTNASTSEIKSAYRKLARIYHPDVNKDDNAILIFKEITSAYETLCNELERKKYDTINCIFKNSARFESSNPYTDNSSKKDSKNESETLNKNCKTVNPSSNVYPSQNKNLNKKNTNSSHNILTHILKGIRQKFKSLKLRISETQMRPQKGENISTEVIITPEEVINGTKKIINLRTTKACPKCNGHRFSNGQNCSVCGGKGKIVETKKITLTIPKGIKQGTKLRLKGEGATGKNGGKNGDLYVVINIQNKTDVRFDKLNIYYNVPITPFEAALGEEITIPAFDGNIKLKLPKNTSSGQKFRIAKQGLKRRGKIGDLIVIVSIEIPDNLSDDEIKLYEQLKKLSTDDVRKNLKYGS